MNPALLNSSLVSRLKIYRMSYLPLELQDLRGRGGVDTLFS